MTRTLAAKVIEGIHSQRWTLSGYGGTWAGAMRPLEEYVKRRVERAVKAEREACAKLAESTVCDTHLPTGVRIYGTRAAAAIRARTP
jgi:hypothetical protein